MYSKSTYDFNEMKKIPIYFSVLKRSQHSIQVPLRLEIQEDLEV